jgi:hypothetical protein
MTPVRSGLVHQGVVQHAPHEFLPFFAPTAMVYALPPSPVPADVDAEALTLLRQESLSLKSYMQQCYGISLELDEKSGGALFPTHKRWLRGEEYGFLIRHHYAYANLLKLHDVYDRNHPSRDVYDAPKRKCPFK